MSSTSDDLLNFVAKVSPKDASRVEENFGDGFVRLNVSEAERRQAKHDIRYVEDAVIELLRNARDAGAHHIFLAHTREGDLRTLVVLDDGSGIPETMCERIFDARVTSKLENVQIDRWGVHGRGMALFSIKENAERAEVVTSDPGLGTVMRVLFDVNRTVERKNQSSWPLLGTDDEGNHLVVRGAHNIIRMCCEFALAERDRCEIYLGSISEIVATLRECVQPSCCRENLLFVDDPKKLPVIERLLVPEDANELMNIAASLGLEISERTAHRILASQIKPVRSVFSKLTHRKGPAIQPKEVDLMRDRRTLKVADADLDGFSRLLERDFDYLAERYYLNLTSEPRIRISYHKITVTFPIENLD